MDLNTRYVIDLSQAQTPADIVFELSSIMEKGEASDKKIWLKLGNIALNQSQLLSITSLISSINSTLSIIESESAQTELAAATLGISTKDAEEVIEEELTELEAEAVEEKLESEPSVQYVPMTDHEEESTEEAPEKEIPEEVEEAEEPVAEVEEEEESAEESTEEVEIIEEAAVEEAEVITKKAPDEVEPISEDIQEHLDSIFDSETKLSNILSEEKEVQEMQNWPLTKEADELESIDEEMTDEDYAILQMNTQYHKQTVRSGQVIKSNGNVVIIGDCHPGCEIHAAGDITVWGVLGGIAHAGSKGNTKAKIRALNLNAIQLRIADSFARRPDHIKNIYAEKTNTFTPEEARNINGSIVILKINENKI